eukprot:7129880-Prymnesium_polylepis.1
MSVGAGTCSSAGRAANTTGGDVLAARVVGQPTRGAAATTWTVAASGDARVVLRGSWVVATAWV